MKIINLTSETINIINNANKIINSYKPNPNPISYHIEYGIVADWEGTPISRASCISLLGVPKYEPNTFLIVPSELKCLHSDAADFVTPSQPVLDKDGNLIGYRSLSL